MKNRKDLGNRPPRQLPGWVFGLGLLLAACEGGALQETGSLDLALRARVVRADCVDTPPPGEPDRCTDQARWGKCDEPWMRGYCDRSCGRCPDSTREEVPCPGELPEGPETPWSSYPRCVDHSWMSVSAWCQRFRDQLNDPDRQGAWLVFLGDSITEGWGTTGASAWNQHFGRYRPFNLGIGGDTTQNVLWRIERGDLAGMSPRAVVLLIGTNNLSQGNGEQDTARGERAVVEAVRARLPRAEILVLALFPREERPEAPLRARVERTNEEFARLAPALGVRTLDIGRLFLAPDGTLSREIMPDFLHLSATAYERWAQALDAPLAEMLGRSAGGLRASR